MVDTISREMKVRQMEEEDNEVEIKLVGESSPLKREGVCYVLVPRQHPFAVGDKCIVTITKKP